MPFAANQTVLLGRYVRLVAPGLIDRIAAHAVARGH